MQPHGDSRDHIAKQTNQQKNSDRKMLIKWKNIYIIIDKYSGTSL